MSSLYRLDVNHPEGSRPVRDPILGGDFLTTSRPLARSKARTVAERNPGIPVVCTRIYGAGSMRESFRITVNVK